MCRPLGAELRLPPDVEAALERYREMRRAEPWDWGRDWRLDPAVGALALSAALPPAISHAIGRAESLREVLEGRCRLDDAVRDALGGRVPAGLIRVAVAGSGRVAVETPATITRVRGGSGRVDVLLDLASDCAATVTLCGKDQAVPSGGALLLSVPAAGRADLRTLAVDGAIVDLGSAVALTDAAGIRLRAPRPVRWTVTDDAGGAWFPERVVTKWDRHGRPYFHGSDCLLTVPAVPLTVAATRGIGYRSVASAVTPAAGAELVLDLEPEQWFAPRARGWAGVELHAHLNYSGNLVSTPADAVAMQAGEDLDLLNLLAGNLNTAFVYDREAFEAMTGRRELSGGDRGISLFGVEFRNDLLGHVHALGLQRPPARYHTGHVTEHGDVDWPPNAVACEDLRDGGATVGYCHPAFRPFDRDGSPAALFDGTGRTVEARELVADAALGLVDSMDILSPGDTSAALALYRHLLGTGIRLAATAGTDVFLSISHGFNSDPPGWARTYVRLGDERVSAVAVSAAIRRGETIVTNGPWVDLMIAGRGPGAVFDVAVGTVLPISVEAAGPGIRELRLVSNDGIIARAATTDGRAELTIDHVVTGPGWIAAEAVGEPHPDVLDDAAFALTSPVYVDVDGIRVADVDDVAWCLEACDHLEALVRRAGRFANEQQLRDLLDVVDRARAYYAGRLAKA